MSLAAYGLGFSLEKSGTTTGGALDSSVAYEAPVVVTLFFDFDALLLFASTI